MSGVYKCPINWKKSCRFLCYNVTVFLPVAYLRPKEAPRPWFSEGGGRAFPSIPDHFFWFGWSSYGLRNIIGGVVKKNSDRTPLSPHPKDFSIGLIWYYKFGQFEQYHRARIRKDMCWSMYGHSWGIPQSWKKMNKWCNKLAAFILKGVAQRNYSWNSLKVG